MASKNQFSPQDRIVVVLGAPGSGKSTFIDYAIKGDGKGIGHGLSVPHTREFEGFSYPHPKDGYPVVFVDTPGFDEEVKSAPIVLAELREWLKKKYKGHRDVNFAVVIYLQKIDVNRMSGSLATSLRSMKDSAIPNIVIATTMWSGVQDIRIAERREREIKEDFGKELVNNGCRIERFEDTVDSAWEIVGDLPVVRVSKNQLYPEDRIVVVFGPTGAGKSTFIDIATQNGGTRVGHQLKSHTAEIIITKIRHPGDGHSVVFVDTPSFNDTCKSDTEILSMIAEWLITTYRNQYKIDAILYLHRITDNRVAGSTARDLNLFVEMCGWKAMANVVLVTTMWGDVIPEVGEQREEELKRDFWKDLIDAKCEVMRFQDSFDSAWNIIDKAGENAGTFLLSEQMVDSRLTLNETDAGVALIKELEKLVKEWKAASRRLQELARNKDGNPGAVERLKEQEKEIEDKIQSTVSQIQGLKIPLTRKLSRLFKF